jgi:hypothetical protein
MPYLEAPCTRCGGTRWIPATLPTAHAYTCQRCRAVLAGRPAADPLIAPEARERLSRTAFQRRSSGEQPRSSTQGGSHDPLS